MSWDAVAWFGYSQTCLPHAAASANPAQAQRWSMARTVGAKLHLLLPLLRDARLGQLPHDWRSRLPVAGSSDDAETMMTSTAMQLAATPLMPWEPWASATRQDALNAWYREAAGLFFDALFVAREAIADGRAPDDDWHRHTLPLTIQTAIVSLHYSFQAALVDHAALTETATNSLAAGAADTAMWPADTELFGPAPDYWQPNTSPEPASEAVRIAPGAN